MAIITFWSNGKEQVGKTLSVVAVATNIAIENNKKTLIVSTSYNERTLLNCFFKDEMQTKIQRDFLADFGRTTELESGMHGLYKLMKSGKMNPDIITDYTKVVFKDRLEILANSEIKEKIGAIEQEIIQNYFEMIKIANQHYDYVFVDLDNSIGNDQIEKILKQSDIIVEVFTQRITKIKELIKTREKTPMLKGKNTILLLAKYDKDSKYKAKNLNRVFNEKKGILCIPYDTLFFEASEEGTVPDLFLRLRRMIDKTDSHAFFMANVKEAAERILFTNHEIRLK